MCHKCDNLLTLHAHKERSDALSLASCFNEFVRFEMWHLLYQYSSRIYTMIRSVFINSQLLILHQNKRLGLRPRPRPYLRMHWPDRFFFCVECGADECGANFHAVRNYTGVTYLTSMLYWPRGCIVRIPSYRHTV